jgi:hypothetical protein
MGSSDNTESIREDALSYYPYQKDERTKPGNLYNYISPSETSFTSQKYFLSARVLLLSFLTLLFHRVKCGEYVPRVNLSFRAD